MAKTNREILCPVSAKEGNNVAIQSLDVLQLLGATKYRNGFKEVGGEAYSSVICVLLPFRTV